MVADDVLAVRRDRDTPGERPQGGRSSPSRNVTRGPASRLGQTRQVKIGGVSVCASLDVRKHLSAVLVVAEGTGRPFETNLFQVK